MMEISRLGPGGSVYFTSGLRVKIALFFFFTKQETVTAVEVLDHGKLLN